MILHSMLKQLEIDGFGTVAEDLQPGTLPIDAETGKPRNGIALALRGLPVSYLWVEKQAMDFYVRDQPLTAAQKAKELLQYLKDSYSDICNLPDCPPYATETYRNVTLQPVSSIEWVGDDDNGGTTYVVSSEISFVENN